MCRFLLFGAWPLCYKVQSFKKWMQKKLPFIFFVILGSIICCLPDDRIYLLPVLFLLSPFLDKDWPVPVLSQYQKQWSFWSIILLLTGLLIVLNPEYIESIVLILLFTALPEEWFFRSYFMQRLEVLYKRKWTANIMTSLAFALLHIPVQGWQGLSVFVPSLMFGWLYQRNRDLILVILLHTFFNGIYIIYLRDILNG